MIKLIHGDCLEKMEKIETRSIDAIITDPPYGTTACKWDSVIPFDQMWEQLNRIIKKNGAIVLFGSEPFSSYLRISNIKNYKYDWVWEKSQGNNFMLAKKQPLKTHENVCVFYHKQCLYSPQKTIKREDTVKRNNRNRFENNIKSEHFDISRKNCNSDLSNEAYPRSVQYFKSEKNNQYKKQVFHPTQKPVALMEYLIKTYTNEGETILDFTMGSGTTGVACKNLNRNFIGIELDKKYFKIAQERCGVNPLIS